jgi:Acyclic terpene utilisation family protein AtuA
MTREPIRIANFSGYLGDRRTALSEVLAGDPVDVVVGDYLAEVTLASVTSVLVDRPEQRRAWYVRYFLDQLTPHLGTIAERGIRVVVNAGAFNPAGLAQAIRDTGTPLAVAHLAGDDILDRLPQLRADGHQLSHLDTGAPLSTLDAEPLAATAYLGGWGIVAALQEGADIVICGRVTDASLVLGPAAWWHGWQRADWDALAGAVVAGHIIECGPQAVGGNFSGFTRLPRFTRPGFPIAEVAADGSSVITKHSTDEGSVTTDTVTAQLLYEIQGPHYLNPDVVAHLDGVRLEQAAPDRVRVHGVTGSPPPPTTKVAIYAQLGHELTFITYLTGLDLDAKLDLLTAQLQGSAADHVELVRYGSVVEDPRSQWETTVPVRIVATARDVAALRDFRIRYLGLGLSSIPGFYVEDGVPNTPTPRIEYWPGLLPQEVLRPEVVLPGGRRVAVGPVPATAVFAGQPRHAEPGPYEPGGPTTRAPLGLVAYARTGDKAGNSNLGIWAATPAAWPWLRALLSTEELRRLLPEAKDLDIVRHEFPLLHAVHFVLPGLLGTSASANLRVDALGKAVGEFVRARHVDIPSELLG